MMKYLGKLIFLLSVFMFGFHVQACALTEEEFVIETFDTLIDTESQAILDDFAIDEKIAETAKKAISKGFDKVDVLKKIQQKVLNLAAEYKSKIFYNCIKTLGISVGLAVMGYLSLKYAAKHEEDIKNRHTSSCRNEFEKICSSLENKGTTVHGFFGSSFIYFTKWSYGESHENWVKSIQEEKNQLEEITRKSRKIPFSIISAISANIGLFAIVGGIYSITRIFDENFSSYELYKYYIRITKQLDNVLDSKVN